MKNFLILLAVVLVGAGVYWKFRDRIHGKVEEIQKSDGKGESKSIVDSAKSVIPGASGAKAEAKMSSLVDAVFVRNMPDSLTSLLAGGQKADLVLETSESEEAGSLPPRIQLSPNAVLDTSGIQIPAGAKAGTLLLVHLLAATPSNANVTNPQFLIQCTAEPAPASVQDSLSKSAWRTAPVSAPVLVRSESPSLWITEFVALAKRKDLRGNVTVEGTFSGLRRAGGNQNFEAVTLEEAKEIQFHVAKGTMWHNVVQEAEQLRKQGNRITLTLLVRTEENPKYIAQEVNWRAPLKDKYEYWRRYLVEQKKLQDALALCNWAEIRGLNDEAKELYESAKGIITRESLAAMGIPRVAVRIHLADEVQDHRVFGSSTVTMQSTVQWRQQSTPEILCAQQKPAYVVLHMNSRNESSGNVFPVE